MNPMKVVRRQSYVDDDDISLSSDDSYGKLGDTLVRATKFLGTIVKGNRDGENLNELDIDRFRQSMGSSESELNIEDITALHDRFTEASESNLHFLRSVRNADMGSYGNFGMSEDDLASLEELHEREKEGEANMPRIDEDKGGEDELNNGTIPTRGGMTRRLSDVSTHSAKSMPRTRRRGSSEFDYPSRRSSSENAGVSRGVMGRMDSMKSLFSHTSANSGNSGKSIPNRRSSAMSTMTEDSSDRSSNPANNASTQRFGVGSISEKLSSSIMLARRDSDKCNDISRKDFQRMILEDDNGTPLNNGTGITDDDNGNEIINSREGSYADHHAKSRAKFTKRNLSRATETTESFRNLQMLMKEKGAITGNAIVHLLQEVAEEHAVNENNENGTRILHADLNSNDASIDFLATLEESKSFKPTSRASRQPINNGSAAKYFNHDDGNSITSGSISLSSLSTRNIIRQPSKIGRRTTFSEEQVSKTHEAMQIRLEQDPMFGSSHTARPFISIPSRESKAEKLIDVIRNAADQGQSCLLNVRGDKFVGKTKLVQKMIDTVQIQGMGYTVLSSARSAHDVLTSFSPFREIVSAALRSCDAVTQRSDESHNSTSGSNGDEDEGVEETDDEIVQRLVQRKILNKSDRLMIGRIIPSVVDSQLLSLLKGRNPTALSKDMAASLFKIMIPLQPVMLVFEADGDDCEIDPSSWDLIEELLLSAGKQCPQMLLVAISRHQLKFPTSITEKYVDLHIERMNPSDSESYIRALFCDPNCIDRNMSVDSAVVDGVYDRAQGCPLFTERLVLWAQMKEVIELDETRNAVALNFFHDHGSCNGAESKEESLLNSLPHNLNEEILEVINNIPHHLLDALKVAASIGISFDVENYQSLKNDEGFRDSLQAVMESHSIFDETDGCYKWKHVAVFEAVESIIISNERIEIQSRISDSLLRDGEFHVGSYDNALCARHFAMAERWDDAFDQYMEGGSKAEEKLDFMGAVEMYQQAKKCLAKSQRTPSLQRKLSPHAALGWCLRELVRYQEAEKELEFCLKQTMAVPEKKRDAEFEEIELDVTTTLATLKQAQSKYSEAMEMYERALPIARANKEKHSRVWLAHHVASCAEIHRKSGDLEQAKGLHTEAMGYRERAVEEQSCTILELALSFTQLGCTLSGLGDYSRAFSLHKKALAGRVENLDFYHSLVSESLNYCADALQALQRGGEGIPLGMHAVKIRKFVFGPHHPAYAHALSVLASCYHSVGRSFDSLGLLKECIEICEKVFSKNHANMIPNLKLYGSVLSDTGKMEKAREVYERALCIHKMNFKEGQNAHQLVKLQNAMKELSKSSESLSKASLEMPIPSFEHDNSKTHAIVCADIGHRASDEYMLSVAASLQKMGILKLVSVIAVSPPQVVRADIARGALDSLMLSNVPVAYSGVVSSSTKAVNAATFNADYGKPSAHVNNTGVELITRALLRAPEKSLVILATTCLGDVSEVINTHRDLFASKVKQVVVIGSVKPFRRRSFVEPENYGGEKENDFARNVYRSCQELQVPTVTLCKDIHRGFPFPSAQVDDLASSNHFVATKIQRSEEMQANGLWELIKQLKQESRGYRIPKEPDVKRFHKYTLCGKQPNSSQHNIWPMVVSINLELVLGLLCCIPMYQDEHFRWDTHQVKGVDHKICRHTNAAAGIIKPEALSNEIHMLVGFALRTSLLNTSC